MTLPKRMEVQRNINKILRGKIVRLSILSQIGMVISKIGRFTFVKVWNEENTIRDHHQGF